MTHIFVWFKKGLYSRLYNRQCRILVCRKGKALVEFENGEKVVTLSKALRRIKRRQFIRKGGSIGTSVHRKKRRKYETKCTC